MRHNPFQHIIIPLILFLAPTFLFGQWDRDAGITSSLPIVDVVTSSNSADKDDITDNNDNTEWTSGNPLPTAFFTRQDLNILLDDSSDNIMLETSGISDELKIRDGDLGASSSITTNNEGLAFLRLDFPTTTHIERLYLKAGSNNIINIHILTPAGEKIWVATHNTANNFQINTYIVSNEVSAILLEAPANFSVFEIAALSEGPKEYAIFDLGEITTIGGIRTRHLAQFTSANQYVTASDLYVSDDSINWQHIQSLDPLTDPPIYLTFEPAIEGRFIKLEHTLNFEDYRKVFIWEVDIFNEYGRYGKMPAPLPSSMTFGDFIGINTVWGWEQDKQSQLLDIDEGQNKFNDIFRHARNYHFMNWDIQDPDDFPDFQNMKDGFGPDPDNPNDDWLSWFNEYKAWQDAGFETSATVRLNATNTYTNLANWDNPYQSAYTYGNEFAKFFGSNGDNLITMFEVGNEPWNMPDNFYAEVLAGMAKGVKDGDPNMILLPAAFQAYQKYNIGSSGNYMGNHIPDTLAHLLDGLNIHVYSIVRDPVTGVQNGTYPESLESEFRGIINAINWRDHNMPNKPIYMTEWGWDSPSEGVSCDHNECVSETEAVAYITRGAMIAWRLGMEKAYWYFHNDTGPKRGTTQEGDDFPASFWHTRAGLLQPQDRYNAKEKKNWYVFETLKNIIGDRYFLQVIQEDKDAWIYLLGDEEGSPTHIVAWRPIDGNISETIDIDWYTNTPPQAALLVDGSPGGTYTELPSYENFKMTIPTSATPIIITLPNGALPVEWLNVSGTCHTKGIHLEWEIASDNKTDYFRIESSADGFNFTPISNVVASSSTARNNATYDFWVKSTNKYFRIVDVDTYGQESVSPIVATICAQADTPIVVFPNPSKGDFTITLEDHLKETGELLITNALGQTILQESIAPNESIKHIHFKEQKGVYFAIIRNSEEIIYKEKIVVQ